MVKAMKTTQSVAINLPADQIFAYMVDLENLVDWSGATIAVRKISPGALHVGATLRTTIRFLGRWMDIPFEVVEFEPGRCLTIKSLSGATPCLFCYQLEPNADGGTSVSLETVIQLTGGMLGLADSVVTNVVRRQIKHDLLTLKDVLEGRTFPSRNVG
jgi:uncharacterized membrane protein